LRFVFLAIFSVLVGLGFLLDSQMYAINKKSVELTESWIPSIVYTGAMDAVISKFRMNVAYYPLAKDPAEWEGLDQRMNRLNGELVELRQKYLPVITSEEENKLYLEFSKAYDGYFEGAELAMFYAKKGDIESAADLIKHDGILFAEVGDALKKLVQLNVDGGYKASLEGTALYAYAQNTMLVAAIALLILLLLLAWSVERTLSRPLAQLTENISSLARGETTVQAGFQDRYDEVGQMAAAVRNIAATLQALSIDSRDLIQAAQEGMLSTRVDAERHPGEFGDIVSGMNQLLEVLSKPLTDVAQVMQQLALGNLQGRMQGAYEGDLRALKANVNRSLETLVAMLEELGGVTRYLASGNLTKTMTGSYQGDFSDLKNNVNQAVLQLKEVLQTVAANTEYTQNATLQTFQAASLVATQTSEQMSALEEVAAVIEETAAAISEISSSARKGNTFATATADLAEKGRLQLATLISIIEKISSEYKLIEQTTVKITRIADKTHLLSLNAGLEALRAGEHGLGFGFVAQQIGKLAEEAAIAARDIGTVIAGSAESVVQSVSTAQETRSAIERIAKAARASGSTVQEISAGIAQQSAAAESLSQQVSKLQSSGEKNATAAEEISRNMQQLAETVQQTATQVQRFTLT
jgi:methyl-accepting chemotaxis protein